MAAPIAPVVRMTAEEFFALPGDDLTKKYELVDGVILPVPPPPPQHDFVIDNVLHHLGGYVRARRLGRCTTGSGGFKLAVPGRRGDTVRAPDVGFISAARLRTVVRPGGYGGGAPDLAVEVRSPSNTTKVVLARRDDLFADGTRLFWDVDPRRRTATVHAPGVEPRLLGVNETLDGGDVVPGFAMRVADLFDGLDDLDA